MGDVHILQVETHTPKFRAEGFGLGLEHGYFLFNGEEVGVGAVIPLDVGVDSSVIGSKNLSDDKRIGVRMSLDISEEPGGKGVGDLVSIDVGGSIQVLDEDGIIGTPGCAHDVTLVDIFDVSGLHSESINDDGEVGDTASILFETFRAFDCISLFISADAAFELLHRGPRTSSYSFDADQMVGLLLSDSCGHSLLLISLSLAYGVVDAPLSDILLLAKAGDKLLVAGVSIDGGVQFLDSGIGDTLGQGCNSLGCKLVSKVGKEVEGTFQFHDGDFGKFHDVGQHFEVNLGSKDFACLKHVIGRRSGGDGSVVSDEDGLGLGVQGLVGRGRGDFEVDDGSGHCEEQIITLRLALLLLSRFRGCLT